HAEEGVRSSELRLRAMLEAALDAVVTMDHRGRVLGWNHAAETTFGYGAHEAVGRDMADLIVPPSLRSAHRKGLARFLETGDVLDQAIDELAGGLEEIRELASGLHPSVLSERGLAPALEALVLRAPVPVELAAVPDHPLPEPVEAAAYYVVAEALANVQKHAG